VNLFISTAVLALAHLIVNKLGEAYDFVRLIKGVLSFLICVIGLPGVALFASFFLCNIFGADSTTRNSLGILGLIGGLIFGTGIFIKKIKVHKLESKQRKAQKFENQKAKNH